ncbi:MAG: 3-hydroxyacyl-CoA dehydrogenase [Planctomycetes bacterium]|nr:3-hydroxyacyl-CoA dehydrogenase [Planctomycetota bacterium]
MIRYTVSGGVCVLALDAPPLNMMTFPLLDELRAAVRRANEDAEVRGIILTGRPDHFSAGADVGLLRDAATDEAAVRTSRVFQEAFQAVEDSARPFVAAAAGRVMGSALELAMACHFRVCDAAARFGMPEVTLGINPGAGGTQRLPRLVGAEQALKMLLTGEAVGGQRALEFGLVDAICDGGDLVECARAFLRTARPPRRTGDRTDKTADAAANAAAFARARDRIAGVRPEIIAPRIILDAVRTGLEESFQAGLRKEQEGFAQCMRTAAPRNKIYLFFATREAGRMPGLSGIAAADITRAAVVGMGSMGTGIAQALIAGGIRASALDQNRAAVDKGIGRIRSSIGRRVQEGRLEPAAAEKNLGLLSAADWPDIADAQLVIEAVFEDVAVKRTVIGRIEAACGPAAVIASNTSTISLDVLAEGMRRPERLIGMHFFNPAHHMPLVEVIRREAAPPGVVATALKFARAIRKTPVLVRNREGFLVNRLFIPYLKEAFRLLEEGAEPPAIDKAMVEFGFPMGPLALADMAGLDVLAMTDGVLSAAFPAHGPLSKIAARLVERGRLGQKTGAGVYQYEKGDHTPRPSAETAEIIAQVRQEEGRTPRRMEDDEISRRLVMRMVAEALRVMQEGIAERESDLDVAMVLGTGFPDFRGGVMKYARDLGLAGVRADLERLAAECGARYAPCGLLPRAAT